MINENAKDQDEFEYDLNEASEVVWNNIPAYMREKYGIEDILKVLDIEFDYLELAGFVLKEGEELPFSSYPEEIDCDELQIYILKNAKKADIFLTYDELDEILDAENIYLDMNGMLSDAGEWLN